MLKVPFIVCDCIVGTHVIRVFPSPHKEGSQPQTAPHKPAQAPFVEEATPIDTTLTATEEPLDGSAATSRDEQQLIDDIAALSVSPGVELDDPVTAHTGDQELKPVDAAVNDAANMHGAEAEEPRASDGTVEAEALASSSNSQLKTDPDADQSEASVEKSTSDINRTRASVYFDALDSSQPQPESPVTPVRPLPVTLRGWGAHCRPSA